MRIDAYNQIAQIYGVQNTYTNQKVNRSYTNTKGNDQLSISSAGYSYQAAKNAVSEASEVREDKVARLKAQIQAGTYSVSAADFANKLLSNYNAIV